MLLRTRRPLPAQVRSLPGLLGPSLALACVLLQAADAHAALRGRIRGTIRDMTGKPLPGLLVRLASPQLGVMNVTDTDGKGVYAFEELEAGSYDIEVSGYAYQHQIKKGIVVQPPFRNIVDFSLPAASPSTAEAPAPVVYTAPADESVLREVLGTLRDKDKRPIPDALVILANPRTGATFRVQSDREGRIRLEGVPVGVYRTSVTSPGYVTIELKQVEVTRESGLLLNLSLVEYPLRFEGRPEDFIPEEKPIPPEGTPR
jgi:carboxypeptidase family protein